ncbi:MAG: hypothetical protein QOG86_2466 [Thermoleophilaceae bacterium]|nr:hypothetical protein [Thermoleophilaceae bacterium]
MRNVLILAALAGFATAASAEQGSTAPTASAKLSAYGTKKICRTETDLGTRLGGKRICRTQQEWDTVRAEQRRATERAQTQGSACLRGANCGG